MKNKTNSVNESIKETRSRFDLDDWTKGKIDGLKAVDNSARHKMSNYILTSLLKLKAIRLSPEVTVTSGYLWAVTDEGREALNKVKRLEYYLEKRKEKEEEK